MCDLPANFEQLESEHNKHYDPWANPCPSCGSEEMGDNVCLNCGEVFEDE
jgi:ribosomal protein L32